MINDIHYTISISTMRPDDRHVAIDADNGHFQIATVVARLNNDTEDRPELIQFANKLVARYNECPQIAAQADALSIELMTMQQKLDAARAEIELHKARAAEFTDAITSARTVLRSKSFGKAKERIKLAISDLSGL